MSDNDTPVNQEAVKQETTPTESAPVENKTPEVAESDDFLEGFDPKEKSASESETDKPKEDPDKAEEPKPEDPKVEETPEEDQSQGDEKPLAPKSENRFQKLANENRELRQYIEQINSQAYQPQSIEDLMEEGDSQAIAEVKSLKQQMELDKYNTQVYETQRAVDQQAYQVLQDFPMFDAKADADGNPTNPDYKPALAARAAERLEKALIIDPNTNELIGFTDSPYEIYQTIADAYEASAHENQIKGQKANEKMLAAVDIPSGAAPKHAQSDPFLEGLLGKN